MNIYAQLWFDTEDFITPEADDALLGLLTMFSEKKVPATFKLVAEKARMLERRGRSDIISLLHNFEIGYHTEFHSMHPTIAEYCETMGFKEGKEAFFARENPGRLDVERISGKKCICFGQPGNSWAPQIYPALLQMGIPLYMDSHPIIDGGRRPYWFGGMLNYLDIDIDAIQRMSLEPDGMDAARSQFEKWKQKHKDESVSFLNIYYHPCEFSCTKFYDLNFARGANPPREAWWTAPLRKQEEMHSLIKQLGDFVDFLRSKEVNIITPSMLLNMESSKKGEVPKDMVLQWAKNTAGGDVDCLVKDSYSISCVEGLSLIARMLLGKPLIPSFTYGPEKYIRTIGKDKICSPEKIARAVLSFFDENDNFVQLPQLFETENIKISPLDAAAVLSQALIKDNGDFCKTQAELKPALRVNPDPDWSSWPIHREDFRALHILELACQQMWTFKPALF